MKILPKMCVATALLLSACGPAAIGIGLGSSGGGGGGGTPVSPSLIVPFVPFQPEADATLLGIRVSQPAGRSVSVRFEYDLGFGRMRIPNGSIVAYDVNARASQPLPPPDPNGDVRVDSTAGGTEHFFLWRHAVDLGQVEKRGVTVFAVFADGETGIRADTRATTALFTSRTIGREVAAVEDLIVSRVSGSDPESGVVIDAVHRDHGADFAVTTFEVEYATTVLTPTEQDYVSFGQQIPVLVSESQEADERVRSDIRFTLDPIAAGLLRGQFQNFWVRVKFFETYPDTRANGSVTTASGSPATSVLSPMQLGHRPRIEFARCVDPGDPQFSAGEDGKPWLKVPISMRLFNPSPSLPMEIRIGGTYTITDTFPITPFETGDPSSTSIVTLQPQERVSHYLIWNVVRDEGLGNAIDPTEQAPNNQLRTADINVTATLLNAGSVPVASGASALMDTQNAGFTTLSTNPFVGFRDTLVAGVRKIWSNGDQITQQTRNLLFTEPGMNSVQETQIRIDQQFEPVQYLPAPPPYDFSVPPWNFTNGVLDIVPTDFEPDQPDCLVWISNQFFYMRWPDSSGASVQQIGAAGPTLATRGQDPIWFRLQEGGTVYDVAVFYSFTAQTVGANQTVQVRLSPVVRSNGSWSLVPSSDATFDVFGQPFSGTPAVPVNIRPVGGEYDGDPATHEVVLGTLGTEYASAQTPGLLHMWSIGVSGGQVSISAPVELPKVPAPTVDPTQNIEPWLMNGWRPAGVGRDALVVVRQLNGAPRTFDVWSLEQQAGGGFVGSQWQLVDDSLDATTFDVNNVSLRRIFSDDIDGKADGNAGSELMLLVTEQDSSFRWYDLWLLAESANSNNGLPVWRRIQHDIRTIDPVTLQETPGQMDGELCQLVDVNGDRLLDLVTSEGIPILRAERNYNYFASSLSSVAGRLGDVANTAGAFPCVLPAIVDANLDGFGDLISGRRLHVANPDGSYSSALANLGGGVTSRHRVERLGFQGGADELDLIVFDPDNAIENKIERLVGIGSVTETYDTQSVLSFGNAFGAGVPIQDMWPLTAPDSAQRGVKDVVAMVGTAGNLQVQRGRIEIATSTVVPELLWGGSADLRSGLAVVRRDPIAVGDRLENNQSVQDVVAVNGVDNRSLVVLRSDSGYAADFVDVPAGLGRIVRMASASLTNDAYEDVCVLTEQIVNSGQPDEFKAYRVVCFEHVPGSGITGSSPVLELARFSEPFAESAIRAFGFDRSARTLANGFLLTDEDVGGSLRSEVRLLRPIVDGASTLRLRVVRSPLSQPADEGAEAVVVDSNQDGQIEVVTGKRDGSGGLQRLQTNLGN